MRNRPASIAAWLVTAVGSVGIIAGTFLPWVASGRVERHLYQLAGVADRLGFLGRVPVEVLIALPVLCALPTGLMALSLPRTGAVVALVLSATAVLLGGAALVVGGGRAAGPVTITPIGPVTVGVGGLLVFVGALITVRSIRPARRSSVARP